MLKFKRHPALINERLRRLSPGNALGEVVPPWALTAAERFGKVRRVLTRKPPCAMCICCLLICNARALAEDELRERDVVVNAESDESEHNEFTEMGEYGQPAWAERARASSTTSVYVLSPYEAFVGLNWEGDFHRHGKSLHDLTQEIDVGLLYRFELGFENELGLVGSDASETSATLEARYAIANWNKIPLNPAISVEYIFGLGKSARSARVQSGQRKQGPREQPDAVALRLLLGQAFADNRIGYGLNVSMQQDVTHDSGRSFVVSQSASYGLMKGEFELGAEMRYTHSTGQSPAGREDELIIGPTFGWKPTRQTRVSFAPLFGCTHNSPAIATFVLFSYEFGGAEAIVPSVAQRDR